jgi:hypothetical protein
MGRSAWAGQWVAAAMEVLPSWTCEALALTLCPPATVPASIKYPSSKRSHPFLLGQNVAGQLDLARGELPLPGIPFVGLLH